MMLTMLALCASALAGGLPRDEGAFHTGESVSDAYVDPEEYAVRPSDLKAVGFDYDYETLTYELVWAEEFDQDGRPDSAKFNGATPSFRVRRRSIQKKWNR